MENFFMVFWACRRSPRLPAPVSYLHSVARLRSLHNSQGCFPSHLRLPVPRQSLSFSKALVRVPQAITHTLTCKLDIGHKRQRHVADDIACLPVLLLQMNAFRLCLQSPSLWALARYVASRKNLVRKTSAVGGSRLAFHRRGIMC